MMPTKSILVVVLIGFLVGACSPATPLSVTEFVPTQTLSVSNTSIPTSLPTPTNLPDPWEASKNCVTEYPNQPENIQLEGVAVLRSLSSTVTGLNLSLQNLKDASTKAIDTANQSVWDVAVSPGRNVLAYSWFNDSTSKWEVVLVSSSGNPTEVTWSSDKEFSFRNWLNDHQLLILQDANYVIADPSQDSQVSYSPQNFPEFNLYHSDYFVSFDPLLSKVIYRNGKINVFDLNKKVILSHIKDGYDRTPIVSWRPFGDQAAIVTTISLEQSLNGLPDEIFILENDGQIRQLTHLFENFGLPLSIDTISWSPDGSKIAFWLHDKEANTTLMVTDYETGKSVNYCITNNSGASFPISVSAPIWSPDGKYLMVENRYANDKNRVLIVELSTNSAFPIAENASPVGWMVEKP
jgi:hypothetical protein